MPDKALRVGFTTGAAAAAAAKAALYFLLTGKKRIRVKIKFLNGTHRFINIFNTKKIKNNTAQCLVVKDAGDDPDITHKALIGVRLTIKDDPGTNVEITGGKGVGKITKPGLELNVGEYAINTGPRKMIIQSLENVFANLKKEQKRNVIVKIFVPKGTELAKKTLNARLGIIGGISILGTTGIVYPMSHDAYIATIRSGAKIAAAGGADTLVFTTGRRSERFAMNLFPWIREECFIQTGDFFKASIDEAVKIKEIRNLIITVFFGKAVKMAMGFEHTHAARAELTMEKLGAWARSISCDKDLVNKIKSANTARHAFTYIFPGTMPLIHLVGNKIVNNAEKFSENKLKVRSIIFDFNGNMIFDSASNV